MKKLFRIATVPISLNVLLKGQLRYLNQFYNVTAISSPGDELLEVKEREGVKIHAINMERDITIFKDLISLYRLYVYFRQEKPDIVHSITPKGGLLTMVAARLAGVPVRMHTFTGLIFPYKKGFLKFILIWIDRILADSATHIYPEGTGVKRDLLRYQITRKPLQIIANGNVNGIDLDYFKPGQISIQNHQHLKAELGFRENDFVFIFVGRLVKDKGINELITAFTILTEPSVKLLLVGNFEQDLDPLTEETLNEIHSNPNIIAVGFQKEVRLYLMLSNVMVFPSYREGFPNVVLQSLAMELPVIVTNISGCNEIVTDRKNGLIIPTKSSVALQTAMQLLVYDTELYDRLRLESRSTVLPYEQKKLWNALLLEYNHVSSDLYTNS